MDVIPMNEIKEVPKQIATLWADCYAPNMFIQDRVKLASDIQNYGKECVAEYRKIVLDEIDLNIRLYAEINNDTEFSLKRLKQKLETL